MRNIVRTWITHRDQLYRLIIFMTVVLFCIGLFFLFYAYIAEAVDHPSINIFIQLGIQIFAFLLGFGLMFLVARFRYQLYRRFIFTISILTGVAMLILMTPLAVERNGAVRWIDFGLLQFQPSEVMKIAFILFFAFLFTHKKVRSNVKHLIAYTLGAFFVLAVASWAQPDYGTILIIVAAVLGMALIARLPWKWWIMILIIAIAGVGFISAGPSYISTRITTFYDLHFGELTPEQRYGDAYHSLQNLQAVRVGGAVGQGPGFVSQSAQLDIPEVTTDSIFALVAAETGFIGSLLLIFIFLLFFTLCYAVADFTKDLFGRYIVVGIATMFAAQFFVNILVVLGFPATGIPLIFFSRGGTSLLLTFVAVGIILNVLQQQPIKRELYRGSLV